MALAVSLPTSKPFERAPLRWILYCFLVSSASESESLSQRSASPPPPVKHSNATSQLKVLRERSNWPLMLSAEKRPGNRFNAAYETSQNMGIQYGAILPSYIYVARVFLEECLDVVKIPSYLDARTIFVCHHRIPLLRVL